MRFVVSIALLSLLLSFEAQAQADLSIDVRFPEGAERGVVEAFIDHSQDMVRSDARGRILIKDLEAGPHVVTLFAEGYRSQTLEVLMTNVDQRLKPVLEPFGEELRAVDVVEVNRDAMGMTKLKYIEVDGLYAAKKNEIVLPDEMPMNRSNNTSRQLFTKVPGINIQETDAGGLQLGVGARGLDPKRTTNFNTRQDGYDIAADALGYPESYYTPPIEAVERIELVRGAASLQYGTQFGGLLNFRMKRGNADRPFEVISRNTAGSYNNFGSFTSVGGQKGGWNYYTFFRHRSGEGWRPNAHFVSNSAYAFLERQLTENWSVSLAYTHSYYNAKQPGGLTDRQFELDPSHSFRDRNWFRVNWNVFNVTINGQITPTLSINSKTFALHSSRAALGFLGSISRVDTGGFRDLILGEFNNVGNETRLIQRFNIGNNPGALLVGTRLYRGDTRNRQGKASAGSDADYRFNSPDDLEGSDFHFPSENAAFFAELLIPISACWYVTPGVRLEHIRTATEGYFTEMARHPLTNELLFRERVTAERESARNIALGGIGVAWRCLPDMEVYANASQNYRAMNFSDLYVSNPNLVIAPDLKDESGYTMDLGIKGSRWNGLFNFDAGVFMMHYSNRIGERLTAVTNEQGVRRVVNYRDNIADARFIGLEVFEELNLLRLFQPDADARISWYNNIALVRGEYIGTEVSAFDGNKVENVPSVNYRTGISFQHEGFMGGLQFNYISEQFTDATNATFFPDATVGVIPAYTVLDLSAAYEWERIRLEGSVNNLTDEIYFTRRATGYPGPGIIPAERRMFFMTLQLRL
jgi:Fe(3+) dicitrate transport protein